MVGASSLERSDELEAESIAKAKTGGEQGGPPRKDVPICAEIGVSLPDGRRAGVSIAVGTFRTGVQSKPALWLVYGIAGSKTEFLRNLSDLRAWLKRPTY
jgi:hypothetical protein